MKILKLPREATLDDLHDIDGKAELVNGRIVLMSGSGFHHARVAFAICRALYDHECRRGGGYALSESVRFAVELPRRRSFQPDASWYTGPPSRGPIVHGVPALAVEVRSEGDYGLRAEREMAAKRADYFAAGTLVVWDVDELREGLVRVYRADDPENPTVYHRGEVAEAEPAVPGWRIEVDELFR
jgi:Uma2 family endonuclease